MHERMIGDSGSVRVAADVFRLIDNKVQRACLSARRSPPSEWL